MTDPNNGSFRDTNAPRRLPRSRSEGHQDDGGDIRNFMSTFRSALSRIDDLNSGRANEDSHLDPNDLNRDRAYEDPHLDPLPRSRADVTSRYRDPSGYRGYSGFRPEGLLSLALLLSSSPFTTRGHEDVDFEEESQYESGQDFVRYGYSRRRSRRTAFGQRTSRESFRMMAGPGGFGMQATRSSTLSGMLGLTAMQLLMQGQGRYCPIHGTECCTPTPPDEDTSGPIITEIDDDDDESADGQPILALPAPTGHVANKDSANTNKNKNVNKNTVCRRSATRRNGSFVSSVEEKEDPDGMDLINQVDILSNPNDCKDRTDSSVDNTIPEKGVLKRKHVDPHQHDNRHGYEEEYTPPIHPTLNELSNMSHIVYKSQSKSDMSGTSREASCSSMGDKYNLYTRSDSEDLAEFTWMDDSKEHVHLSIGYQTGEANDSTNSISSTIESYRESCHMNTQYEREQLDSNGANFPTTGNSKRSSPVCKDELEQNAYYVEGPDGENITDSQSNDQSNVRDMANAAIITDEEGVDHREALHVQEFTVPDGNSGDVNAEADIQDKDKMHFDGENVVTEKQSHNRKFTSDVHHTKSNFQTEREEKTDLQQVIRTQAPDGGLISDSRAESETEHCEQKQEPVELFHCGSSSYKEQCLKDQQFHGEIAKGYIDKKILPKEIKQNLDTNQSKEMHTADVCKVMSLEADAAMNSKESSTDVIPIEAGKPDPSAHCEINSNPEHQETSQLKRKGPNLGETPGSCSTILGTNMNPSETSETGKQNTNDVLVDTYQHSFDDERHPTTHVNEGIVANHCLEKSEPIRAIVDPNDGGYDGQMKATTGTTTESFYQMIKRHLPASISSNECDDILRTNPKNDIGNVQNAKQHTLQPQNGSFSISPEDKSPSSFSGQLDTTVKGLIALVDEANTYLSRNTAPTTAGKGSFRNKNASPRNKNTHTFVKSQTKDANMPEFPAIEKHSRTSTLGASVPSSRTSISSSQTGAQTYGNSIVSSQTGVQTSGINVPTSWTSASSWGEGKDLSSTSSPSLGSSMLSTGTNLSSSNNMLSSGTTISSTNNNLSSRGINLSSSNNSMPSSGPNMLSARNSTLPSWSNLSSSATRLSSSDASSVQRKAQPCPGPSSGYNRGETKEHKLQSTGNCHTYNRYARQCTDCRMVHICCEHCDQVVQTICGNCKECDKTLSFYINQGRQNFNSSQPLSVNNYGQISQSHAQGYRSDANSSNSYQNQVYYQKNMATPGANHNVTKTSGMTNSQPTGSTADGMHWPMNESPEEQQSLGDPIFKHPDWKHVTDTADWDFPLNTAPKKPPRNKNVHVRKTPVSNTTKGGDERVDVVPSQTTSPNWTNSSSQQGNANWDSAYNSDYKYNDGNHSRKTSGSDRLSNLSEIMLKEGMVVRDVYPDGNCFFAAVVDQLRVRGEFFYTAKSLRKAAVQYLRKHSKQADGTPLFAFVSDQETTTWEGYLSRLNRDGEWADHIIISAISNVLRRRVLIHSIRRSEQQVNTTVMEPERITRSRDQNQPIENVEDSAHAQDDEADSDSFSESGFEADYELYEDLQLGHIPEAHYVSLRHLDWENRLYAELRARKDDPSKHLTSYGHRHTRQSGDTSTESVPGREIPTLHNEFLIRYIQTSGYILRYPANTLSSASFIITMPFDGLYCQLSQFGNRKKQPETYGYTGKKNSGMDFNSIYYSDKKGDNSSVECLMVPSDTYVYQTKRDDMKRIDLYCDSQNCPPGYTRLCPIAKCWSNNLVHREGKNYLKHLQIRRKGRDSPETIAFKCELPDAAIEWFERDRGHQWPTQSFIDELTGSYSCVVSAQSHPRSKTPSIEWKFCFDRMEHDLIHGAVTEPQKKVFDIFQCLIRYVFPNGPVQYEHLKQVFFYSCERIQPAVWDSSTSECIHAMTGLLLDCFHKSRLPNYFYSDVNMIDYLSEDEQDSCIDKLEVLIAFPFTMLYTMLDAHSITDFYSQITMVDGVIEDVQRYVQDKNVQRTVNECFIQISVRGISTLTSKRLFSSALEQSKTAIKHLNAIAKQNIPISLNTFLYEVLYDITKESYRWMFALFLDQKLDSSFVLSTVDTERETVSLFQILGPALKQSLTKYPDADIRMPKTLTEKGVLLTLILDLIDLLVKELGIEDALLGASLTYFYEHHVDDFRKYMLTCDQTQRTLMSTQVEKLCVHIQCITLKREAKTLRSLLGRE